MSLHVTYASGQTADLAAPETGVVSIPLPIHENALEIAFAMPLVNVQCHWNGNLYNNIQELLPWRITEEFAFQSGPCYAAFFSREGENALSFGLLEPRDVTFKAQMNQAACTYDITLDIRFAATDERPAEIALFWDASHRPWHEALKAWRDLQRPEGGYSYPESAFDPVFCTWYAVHGAVTAAWCEAIAPAIRDLGFKTFILDDGWCYDESKRVTPQTLPDWYADIGEWRFSTAKFPDYQAHVKRLQKLGLNYMIWVAPFLVGHRSALYKQLEAIGGALQGPLEEGHRLVNPGNAEATRLVMDKMTDLLATSGADGLKIDFIDIVQNTPECLSSGHVRRFVTELAKRLREIRPNALLEYRQRYATLQMAPLATQFRAGDAPFDFMLNFKRLAVIRLCMGDGIPVHADPAYWHPAERPENISRHCIAMLAGVPMLSMDPREMGDEAAAIVHRWLAFYEAHRPTLAHGHWTLDYKGGHLRFAAADGDGERIVILADAGALQDALAETAAPCHVLNLSADALAGARFTVVEDGAGKALSTGIAVPIGGLGLCQRG